MTKATVTKKKASKRVVKKCAGNVAGVTCNKSARSEAEKYVCSACRGINSMANVRGRFANSLLGLRMVKTSIRARSVETFADIEAVHDWYEITKACYAVSKDAQYNVSHLFPVGDKEKLGLTNGNNCLLATEVTNKKLGKKLVFSKAVEGVHYLDRKRANKAYEVGQFSEKQEVVDKLFSHIGEANMLKWLEGKALTRFVRKEASEVEEDREWRDSFTKFHVMVNELRGEASWLDVESWFDFEVAFTSYVIGIKGSKSNAWYRENLDCAGLELNEVSDKLEQALLRGCDRTLQDATQLLVELGGEMVVL